MSLRSLFVIGCSCCGPISCSLSCHGSLVYSLLLLLLGVYEMKDTIPITYYIFSIFEMSREVKGHRSLYHYIIVIDINIAATVSKLLISGDFIWLNFLWKRLRSLQRTTIHHDIKGYYINITARSSYYYHFIIRLRFHR